MLKSSVFYYWIGLHVWCYKYPDSTNCNCFTAIFAMLHGDGYATHALHSLQTGSLVYCLVSISTLYFHNCDFREAGGGSSSFAVSSVSADTWYRFIGCSFRLEWATTVQVFFPLGNMVAWFSIPHLISKVVNVTSFQSMSETQLRLWRL